MNKILFLEDDKWFTDSIISFLGHDFEIRVCSDPEKVFKILENWLPDLLLADVMLGAKNLFVLMNEMQSYIDTRNLNVVILSSVASHVNQNDVTKFNVKKILDKSKITPETLLKILMEVLEKGIQK